MRGVTIAATILLAVGMVSSAAAAPLLGGGFAGADTGGLEGGEHPAVDGMAAVELEPPTATADADVGALAQAREDAVEAGVDEGVDLVQAQGVEVSQEQRAAALEGALESAAQSQEADVEQVQQATAGAVHGTLVQEQDVEVEQVQAAVGGATGGALAQSQTVNATQMQYATWGAAHGAIAQKQVATVEQVQVATYGAAAGAAAEAGESEVAEAGKIREAAQGAAYGVVEQYQKVTVEQRQRISLEHVQHAAAGAASGAVEGAAFRDVTQEQRVDVEQYQAATIKGVQKAAMGAAKGALVQRQDVTVEQTQAAAFGAGKGALEQVQQVRIEQIQRVELTQIQEASFGAAKGAIYQSQEATIEQVQAAATGGAGGVLVQRQEVSVSQTQWAAFGASKGAVTSAVQEQVVEVEGIQAAAFGAGQGAVIQKQVVDVTQVQVLAEGASSGALTQTQEATVEQIQVAARSACEETARVIQYQRVSVTQVQELVTSAAADATAYAVDADTADVQELSAFVAEDVAEKADELEDLEGEASVAFADQAGDGETVVVERVDLSEGGFVAVHDEAFVEGEPTESVRGVSAYLEPGEHEDVEIDLEEPLEENRTLTAVAHLDTNGDERFDYVETDGEEDVPYVGQGGLPALDDAVVAPGEPDEEDETDEVAEDEENETDEVDDEEPEDEDVIDSMPEAEGALEVADFEIVGDDPDEEFVTLRNVANETLDLSGWTVEDREDGGLVAAGVLDPYAFPDGVTLEPNETVTLVTGPGEDTNDTLYWGVDRQVWNESGDTVRVFDANGEVVLEEPIAADVPEATLSVADQEGGGETLVVDEANASVAYVLTATDEGGERLAESEPFEANETAENVTLEFDEPLEANATLEVAVRDAETDEELANETVEYALEEGFEEFDAEFECTRAEVTGTFEEGDEFIVGQTAYYPSGVGTSSDYSVSFGVEEAEVNVDAPFSGTVVVELGEEYAVVEETDDEVLIEVPAVGAFDSAVIGDLEPGPGSDVFDGESLSNPEASACLEERRPERPELAVEEVTPTDDGGALEVTFGYENPNDDPISADSEFVEGATADEPPATLEPGTETFTVEWTPETDDERLVWAIDLSAFGYEEPITATTEPASEYLEEPAAFAVSLTGTNAPIEEGESLEVAATVENVGAQVGTQDVTLSIDGEPIGTESVTLEGGEATTVTFSTTIEEAGEYAVAVASEDDGDETTVTVEEASEPAFFAVTDLSAPADADTGETIEVAATVENQGDLEGSQEVTHSVDGVVVNAGTVALDGGESTTVSFEYTIPEALAGSSTTHEVASEDDGESTTVSVASLEPDGPEAPDESAPPGEPGPPGEPDAGPDVDEEATG